MAVTRESLTLLLDILADVDDDARLVMAQQIATDPSAHTRLAAHHRCPAEVLTSLAGSRNQAVRRAVAKNASTPDQVRARLRKDTVAVVRQAAGAIEPSRAATARRRADDRYLYTEENVSATCAAAAHGWDGDEFGAYGAKFSLSRLAATDERWRTDTRLLTAMLTHTRWYSYVTVYLTRLFSPELIATTALDAHVGGLRIEHLDQILLAVAESVHPESATEQLEFLHGLVTDRRTQVAASLRSWGTSPSLLHAVTAKAKGVLREVADGGGIPAAIVARRRVLSLDDLLTCAETALTHDSGTEFAMSPSDVQADAAAVSPFLLELAAQVLEAGRAEALVTAGNLPAVYMAMCGLLPGLREQAFMIAATDDSGDLDLAIAALDFDDIPADARMLLAGHDDEWLRETFLRRSDVTSAEVLVAIAAGTHADRHLIAKLEPADMGFLPWQLARTDDTVRRAVSARLQPVFVANPAAVDVVATMAESFDGTVDEMVAAARLL